MITNKVFRFLQGITLPNGVKFEAGQEIEVVMDVVYVQGYPLPQYMQSTVLSFILQNPSLFRDDTRDW